MIKSYEGTLAGVAVPLTLDGRIRSVSIKNDDAANTYTCTIGGETITVQAGETRGFSLGDDQYGLLTINGTGDYRILASDNDVPPTLIESTSVVVDGAITTAKLANGVLSADAAGRAKMANGYFDQATVLAKFDGASVDQSKLVGKTLNTVGNADTVMTGAQTVASVLVHSPAVARTATTAAAADIIAALPGAVAGTWFRLLVRNAGTDTSTLTAGANVTISGNAVVYGGQSASFLGRVDAGVATVTIYREADQTSSTEDEVDALIASGTIGEDRLAVQVTPRVLADTADLSTAGQCPIVYSIPVAGGAQTVNVLVARKVRVIQAYTRLEAAGGGAATTTIQNGANPITDAIATSAGANHDIMRASKIDDAFQAINAGDPLRVVTIDAASPAQTVYVFAIPVT